MVERYGLPTYFVTLTADESSNLRWGEIADLEDVISKICGQRVNLSALPAENALLFRHHVDALFKNYLLGESGILGRVGQHVIRYEHQGPGSLHAHILLWVHKDDINTATPSQPSEPTSERGRRQEQQDTTTCKATRHLPDNGGGCTEEALFDQPTPRVFHVLGA